MLWLGFISTLQTDSVSLKLKDKEEFFMCLISQMNFSKREWTLHENDIFKFTTSVEISAILRLAHKPKILGWLSRVKWVQNTCCYIKWYFELLYFHIIKSQSRKLDICGLGHKVSSKIRYQKITSRNKTKIYAS